MSESKALTIDDVFLSTEAAEKWNKDPDTVRQACIDSQRGIKKKPFLPGEYRKSKGGWLVTRPGMIRLYGEEPK